MANLSAGDMDGGRGRGFPVIILIMHLMSEPTPMSEHPPDPDVPFSIDEPRPVAMHTLYGCWLTTERADLIEVLAELTCVAAVLEIEDNRYLVEISDDHDADEAWHWMRSALEDAVTNVELDPIWEEAMKWIL
jgi:hypothetical protein